MIQQNLSYIFITPSLLKISCVQCVRIGSIPMRQCKCICVVQIANHLTQFRMWFFFLVPKAPNCHTGFERFVLSVMCRLNVDCSVVIIQYECFNKWLLDNLIVSPKAVAYCYPENMAMSFLRSYHLVKPTSQCQIALSFFQGSLFRRS